MAEPFALTDNERLQPLWVKLKGHLEEQLRQYREANDHPAVPNKPDLTDLRRGRIAMLKDLIRLGDKPPEL